MPDSVALIGEAVLEVVSPDGARQVRAHYPDSISYRARGGDRQPFATFRPAHFAELCRHRYGS